MCAFIDVINQQPTPAWNYIEQVYTPEQMEFIGHNEIICESVSSIRDFISRGKLPFAYDYLVKDRCHFCEDSERDLNPLGFSKKLFPFRMPQRQKEVIMGEGVICDWCLQEFHLQVSEMDIGDLMWNLCANCDKEFLVDPMETDLDSNKLVCDECLSNHFNESTEINTIEGLTAQPYKTTITCDSCLEEESFSLTDIKFFNRFLYELNENPIWTCHKCMGGVDFNPKVEAELEEYIQKANHKEMERLRKKDKNNDELPFSTDLERNNLDIEEFKARNRELDPFAKEILYKANYYISLFTVQRGDIVFITYEIIKKKEEGSNLHIIVSERLISEEEPLTARGVYDITSKAYNKCKLLIEPMLKKQTELDLV